MIDSISEFSFRLQQLNPEEDSFVLQVDQLINETEQGIHKMAYPEIFRFFESHPDSYCGMPGALVHLIEHYYPNYVEALIESIEYMPSRNTVLMVNRILNSDIDSALQKQLIDCLHLASTHQDASLSVRDDAIRYLHRLEKDAGEL